MRKNIVSKLLGVGLLSLCLVSCGKTNVSETKTPQEEIMEDLNNRMPSFLDQARDSGYETVDVDYINSYEVNYYTNTLTYITLDEVERSITLKDGVENMQIAHLYDTKDPTVVENIKQKYIYITYGPYQDNDTKYLYTYLVLIGAIYNN